MNSDLRAHEHLFEWPTVACLAFFAGVEAVGQWRQGRRPDE
ncbi:hypothetical protein [Propionicicella superfundia]|nr:hypothetical protein [Propionicicella superfundia]